jgi:hypothetical protein
MQTGRLTESCMERDLHIGKGAYADRQAYLLSDRESCEEIQRVCRYSVSKGAYADSAWQAESLVVKKRRGICIYCR